MPRTTTPEKAPVRRASKADNIANTVRLAFELKHYVGVAIVILFAAFAWHVAHARNVKLPGIEVER